jgi:hypothetical protein
MQKKSCENNLKNQSTNQAFTIYKKGLLLYLILLWYKWFVETGRWEEKKLVISD